MSEDYKLIVGRRLKEARGKRPKIATAEKAAKAIGASLSTYHQYENGIRLITVEKARRFALKYDVTLDWIYEGKADGIFSPVLQVPKISMVSAGKLSLQEGILPDGGDVIDMSALPPGNWVAFEVEGDSMDRVSPPGSLILVNIIDKTLVQNACYVISNEAGEATYKRYRTNPVRFEPVSTNPSHEPIFPEGPISILGRVRRSVLPM